MPYLRFFQDRFRQNRIKIFLIAFAAVLLTLLTNETAAYYTASQKTVSVVASGGIKAEIVEKMGDGDFPQAGVYILPGSIISKKVTVVNTGSHPFWLRVRLTNAIDDEKLSANILEFDINLDDWIYEDDGFYYYKKAVEKGEETEKLFSQVKISGNVDNSYLNKTLSMTVDAYAVQSEHNGESPLEAVGWPEERGESVK